MPADHVRHDGFARESLHRETSGKACAWCGQKGPKPNYTYTVEGDAEAGCVRPRAGAKAFCNLECYDSYNG